MSSVQDGRVSPTPLRLDYQDLVAGQLVIVIHGLPAVDENAYTPLAGELPEASGAGQTRHGARNGAPSAPLDDEVEAIVSGAEYAPALFRPLLLSAWRGKEALVMELTRALVEDASGEDAGRAVAITEYAQAVLYNGLGRYERAVAAAQRACAREDRGLHGWARLELVEAGARGDARAAAKHALQHLEEGTRAGTEWAQAVWARSAALLSAGDAAEALYREAIERFDRGGLEVHLSRARLVYGEWLRRANRRVDAREQLRAAHHTLSSIAAEAFAERARRELLATGETARKRTDDTRGILTPQEAQIARLARDGLSNPEIGAELFISPRTVQYHLRKVFLKLEISSRNQLGRIPPSRLKAA